MIDNPAAAAARSAALILAPDLGQQLPVEVEAALAARGAQYRPERYLDPVSLAGLIVAIATLAWTIYNDQRNRAEERSKKRDQEQKQSQEPGQALPPQQDQLADADSIARLVRIALREQDTVLPQGSERITEVVVTEIVRHSRQPQE
jgi:hypothetical protein